MAEYIEAAELSDIPVNTLKQVRVKGEAICLANVDGVVHALRDRCGHQSVALSGGTLEAGKISCPLHRAVFDAATGAMESAAQVPEGRPVDSEAPELVQRLQGALGRIGGFARSVETVPVPVYETKVEGGKVLVNL